MLRVSVVLLSVVCVTYAGQAIGPLQPKPEKFRNVPGCYIKELDRVIPFGQSAPDRNTCMEYSCSKDLIHYTSCGVVGALPPLEVVEDKTKLFPDCCPKLRRIPKKTRI